MSKGVTITASVQLDIEQIAAEKKKEKFIPVTSTLSKNFGKREIGNIRSIDGFIYFDVKSVICVPMLLSFFKSLQLFVNGNSVEMSMLK